MNADTMAAAHAELLVCQLRTRKGWPGWPSRSLLIATLREFDSDPTDPECPHRQRSTYCHLMHHADGTGLLVPPAYISADMPLAQKKAIAAVRLARLPQLSAIPSTASHTQTASANGVELE